MNAVHFLASHSTLDVIGLGQGLPSSTFLGFWAEPAPYSLNALSRPVPVHYAGLAVCIPLLSSEQ